MAGLEIGRTGEGSNSQWFMGNSSALCFPVAVTVRFWQSCSGGPMTSLPVLGADGSAFVIRAQSASFITPCGTQHPARALLAPTFLSETAFYFSDHWPGYYLTEEGRTSAFLHNLLHICRVQCASQKRHPPSTPPRPTQMPFMACFFSQQRRVDFFTRNAVFLS